MIVRRLLVAALATVFLASCDQLQQFTSSAATIRDDGAYMVLEVDAGVLQSQQLALVADRMAEALRAATPIIRYTGRGVVGDAARVRLIDAADHTRALAALAALGPDFIISDGEEGVIEARMTRAALNRATETGVTQSIEVLQRRLGRTASVAPCSGGQIIVRTNASAVDPDLRPILTTTALLSFHNVVELAPEDLQAQRLPPGTMLVNPYPGMGQSPEVVERRPRFTGERLMRADAGFDNMTGEPTLAFALDEQGTRIFCRITRERTGQRFAVLLDNQVLTAPRINEPICGGSGIISGFARDDAEKLAVMLRAGALPAPLTIVAEGVGPAP